MSHEESENGHTNSPAGFSNGYENSTDSEAIMSGQSSSHTDHDLDRRHRTADQSDSGSTQFLDPPNPPNLRSRHTDQTFGVLREVGHREVIKLSIEFPLKNCNSANDIDLFFKRFITVLFAANRDILLTKWIPGNENPISKAIDIAYDADTIGEYYSGMKTLHDKRRIVRFTRILSTVKFFKTKNHLDFRS